MSSTTSADPTPDPARLPALEAALLARLDEYFGPDYPPWRFSLRNLTLVVADLWVAELTAVGDELEREARERVEHACTTEVERTEHGCVSEHCSLRGAASGVYLASRRVADRVAALRDEVAATDYRRPTENENDEREER